jgi:hypothetical protein
MVLNTVITIINYDHHMFIVQATEVMLVNDNDFRINYRYSLLRNILYSHL